MARTPRPLGLANVFWGSGIRYQKLTPGQRRSISRIFATFTAGTAIAVGVVVGILTSALAGTIWAVVTLLVVGLLTRATLRDHE